jgi:hypothetical protein
VEEEEEEARQFPAQGLPPFPNTFYFRENQATMKITPGDFLLKRMMITRQLRKQKLYWTHDNKNNKKKVPNSFVSRLMTLDCNNGKGCFVRSNHQWSYKEMK